MHTFPKTASRSRGQWSENVRAIGYLQSAQVSEVEAFVAFTIGPSNGSWTVIPFWRVSFRFCPYFK